MKQAYKEINFRKSTRKLLADIDGIAAGLDDEETRQGLRKLVLTEFSQEWS